MLSWLKQKGIFGDAFWTLVGQLLSALALLVGTRILTELVTPDIYGQVALLNGFIALGVAVFAYPFICAGMRLQPECRNEKERAYLYRAVSGSTRRASLIAIMLVIFGGVGYAYWTQGDPWLFCLTGILLAVTVRRELGVQLLIGQRKHRWANLWQTTDSLLRPLLAISLVWYVGKNAAWVLAGYCLASIVSNTVWSIIQDPKDDFRPDHRLLAVQKFRRDVWRYAAPLIPLELVFWINGLGDRYVIGYLLTAAEVGLYAATYTIINEAFNRSAMILLRVFQPLYFQSISEDRGREAHTLLWIWIACVSTLGLVGGMLIGWTQDGLAGWLLAEPYHAGAALMPTIAAGCALHALGTALAQPLLAKKRTKTMFKGRVAGVVAAAISMPTMVHYFGLPGAAMANPIYFGIEALVLALLAKPWRRHDKATDDPYWEQTRHSHDMTIRRPMLTQQVEGMSQPLPVNR